MHCSMHKIFRSQSFNTRGTIELEGATWTLVDNYLTQTLEPPSYEVVTKCLKQSKIILSRAFNASAIQSAFEKSGIIVAPTGKFDPTIIMSTCPHFL